MNTLSARKPRVLLVFGGRSSEHAVSCATAAGVLSAIDHDRFDVVPVGISRDGHWVLASDDTAALQLTRGHLPEVSAEGPAVTMPLDRHSREVVVHEAGMPPRVIGDVDVVFPLLHGPFGEDGTLQGMLELGDIRYVGCGVTASAVMQDKLFMKSVFRSAGLPVAPYVGITDKEWRRDPEAALAAARDVVYPAFVKPARAGSSMGISRVTSPAGLREAVEAARLHDPRIVVEQGVFGREIECGVLEGRGADAPRASEPGEIAVRQGHDFYDFDAKYIDADDVELSCPADLSEEQRDRVRELSVRAFDVAGCEGLARVDFFLTPDGDLILNEINTMPGFTPHSMFPQMWARSGLAYPDLITELVELALERRVGLR